MHSVRNIRKNIKSLLSKAPPSAITVLIICLVGVSGFSLGWIARGNTEKPPIQKTQIQLPAAAHTAVNQTEAAQTAGLIVSSENSDVYHYRWCSGAQRINQQNKVYFADQKAAEAAGLRPAGNCPGLD